MTAVPAAGWFVDPNDASQWRWWDGTAWTDHTSAVVLPEQRAGSSREPAPAAGGVTSAKWQVPTPGLPIHEAVDLEAMGAVPGIRGARRVLLLKRSPSLVATTIVGLMIAAFGLVLVRVTTSVVWAGCRVIEGAFAKVRDDARDDPWRAAFQARGVDSAPNHGFHPRWSELLGAIPALRDPDRVNARWARRSTVMGFDCFWGELVATKVAEEDGIDRHTYHRFAVFEIPPLAAARHRRVTVRRRGLKTVGATWRSDTEELKLESIQVDRSLLIEVDKGADPVTARELFGPQLVDALAAQPVCWEQRRDLVYVYQPSGLEPIHGIDAFLVTAAAVARAYWTDQE